MDDKFKLVPEAEWKPPALNPADVFNVNPSRLKFRRSIGKSEVNLRIKDEGLQTCILPLFTKADQLKARLTQRKYDAIHFGCFRISVSPLFRLGMNSSAYVALIDNRFITSKHGKIGSFVCPLHQGPVCVDIFPNYTISLFDAKATWKLLIAVKGLDRKLEASYLSVKVSCVFRLLNSLVSPSSTIVETKFGSTQTEGPIIQELGILEFLDTPDNSTNKKDVYKTISLQEKSQSPVCWPVLSIFKPVVPALKKKCLSLQLLQPGNNSVQAIKPGEHSETTEEQESQSRERATSSSSPVRQIEVNRSTSVKQLRTRSLLPPVVDGSIAVGTSDGAAQLGCSRGGDTIKLDRDRSFKFWTSFGRGTNNRRSCWHCGVYPVSRAPSVWGFSCSS